jgi:hypothetical protein
VWKVQLEAAHESGFFAAAKGNSLILKEDTECLP